jgi:hypothetical protein
VNAALCAGGIACVLTGVITTGGWIGLIIPLGSVLFFVGSGNSVLHAHNLGSLLGLVDGAHARHEALTKECQDQRAGMRCIAEQLCADDAGVVRTLDLTTTRVCREWPLGIGTPFGVYLLCRTIATAEAQATLYGGLRTLAPDSDDERRVIHALHGLCDVPPAQIAHMLDRELSAVRAALATAPPERRP